MDQLWGFSGSLGAKATTSVVGSPVDCPSTPRSRAVRLLLADTGVIVSKGFFFSSGVGVGVDVGLGSLITISSVMSFSMVLFMEGS